MERNGEQREGGRQRFAPKVVKGRPDQAGASWPKHGARLPARGVILWWGATSATPGDVLRLTPGLAAQESNQSYKTRTANKQSMICRIMSEAYLTITGKRTLTCAEGHSGT